MRQIVIFDGPGAQGRAAAFAAICEHAIARYPTPGKNAATGLPGNRQTLSQSEVIKHPSEARWAYILDALILTIPSNPVMSGKISQAQRATLLAGFATSVPITDDWYVEVKPQGSV